MSPRGDVRRGALELELYSQLARARVIADLADQVDERDDRGWNAADGAAVTASQRAARTSGPGAGATGAALLREALGERAEHLGHLAVGRRTRRRRVAEAALDLRARRFVRVEGDTEGNAQLRVGAHVTLTGVDPAFDNTYYVVRACHLLRRAAGLSHRLRAECAYLGAT